MINGLKIFGLLLLLNACNTNLKEKDYLQEVSDNLSEIKSATCYLTSISSAPGDTAKFTEPRTKFYKIFVNPTDTLVGSSSAHYAIDDTTKMTDFYDGKVRGKVNWDEQFVKVDRHYLELMKIGAIIVNKPKIYPEYSPVYYALFFKDLEGIKYEIVCNSPG